MRYDLILTGAAVLAVSSCSGKPGTGTCDSNKDCKSGYICRNKTCHRVCVADPDCPGGEICIEELCQKGERPNLPRITSIDGNGTEDAAGGQHAAHHFADALLLGGENFEGASV